MTDRIDTYVDAFRLIDVRIDTKIKNVLQNLEKEGHTEKSISFAIWRTQEKLIRFSDDTRFIGVLINAVRQYSWAKDDERWILYKKKKAQEEKLRQKIKYDQIMSQTETGENRHDSYIYFVQGENGGAIKIGKASDPVKRLKGLQTGFPDNLKLLCLIPGNETREQKAHAYFDKFRIRGEWFKPEKELLETIKKFKLKYPELNNAVVKV